MRKNILFSFLLIGLSSFLLTAVTQLKAQESDKVTIQEIQEFTYCSLPHKGPFTDIQEVIGQMVQAFRSQNLSPTGPLIGIYYSVPENTKAEEYQWEMGFPIMAQSLVQPPLVLKQWTLTTVATCLHTGPYETAPKTITKIQEWMVENGYVQAGPIMERYLDMDPAAVKPQDLKTEIWIPIKKGEK
jgi:effector-binding domain-containing protein